MASRSEYRLKHPPLGVGGQAEVFEAMRRGTNEKVALKRVNARDVAAISRMKHEVEVQRSLNHPHIMPIFDFAPDYSWYTMPVACRILGKLSPPLPEQMVMEVVRHCALGLAHAHAHESIHRDVTPNNIVQTALRSEKFQPYMKRLISYLWNNGDPQEATRAEINREVGAGAYGNHNKLTYEPWGLVENGKSPRSRRLTARGQEFAKGALKIPAEITRDAVTGQWRARPGSLLVAIDEL